MRESTRATTLNVTNHIYTAFNGSYFTQSSSFIIKVEIFIHHSHLSYLLLSSTLPVANDLCVLLRVLFTRYMLTAVYLLWTVLLFTFHPFWLNRNFEYVVRI